MAFSSQNFQNITDKAIPILGRGFIIFYLCNLPKPIKLPYNVNVLPALPYLSSQTVNPDNRDMSLSAHTTLASSYTE